MKRTTKNLLVGSGVVIILCVACTCLIVFSDSIIGVTPTATAISIIQTADIAFTQTALLILPTVAITSTNLPTLTQPVIPTPITIPGSGDTPIPTNTIIFILPTQVPPAGAACACTSDTLNCSDFQSQSSAQACMDYCISVGAGDIHNLDGNANGQACEN